MDIPPVSKCSLTEQEAAAHLTREVATDSLPFAPDDSAHAPSGEQRSLNHEIQPLIVDCNASSHSPSRADPDSMGSLDEQELEALVKLFRKLGRSSIPREDLQITVPEGHFKPGDWSPPPSPNRPHLAPRRLAYSSGSEEENEQVDMDPH